MPELNQELIDFYGLIDGTDTISSAVSLGQTKFRDTQNVNYFPIGGFSWRNGYARLESSSSSSNPVTGLYMARYSTPTNVAVRTIGSKLETMTSLSGTWTDQTGVLTVTNSKDAPWNFAILNDVVVGCNDTDTNIQINSALTAAVLAGSPAFSSSLFCVEFRGYMFYFNTVETGTRQPDRGRFSDLNAPNAFTMLGSNNFIDVAKKQGGDARGGVSYDGRLYVFKRHGIYSIEFEPTRVNSSGTLFPFLENPNPVVEGVGTQSHRSICKFTTPSTHKAPGQELVFFVDQFGVPRIFDGQTTMTVGYPISKSRNTAITSLTSMDRTRIAQTFAVNYPERSQILCWMTKDSSQHDTCWVLDYSTGFAWGRHMFADDFNCGALFEKNDGTFRLYFGTYDGRTMEYDTGTSDNGTAISSYVRLGDVFVKSPVVKANWPWMSIRGANGTTTQSVSIDYYIDGGDTAAITDSVSLSSVQNTWDDYSWDVMVWGADGIVSKVREIDTDASTIGLKLYNTTLSSTATVEGLTLAANPQGWEQV